MRTTGEGIKRRLTTRGSNIVNVKSLSLSHATIVVLVIIIHKVTNSSAIAKTRTTSHVDCQWKPLAITNPLVLANNIVIHVQMYSTTNKSCIPCLKNINQNYLFYGISMQRYACDLCIKLYTKSKVKKFRNVFKFIPTYCFIRFILEQTLFILLLWVIERNPVCHV